MTLLPHVFQRAGIRQEQALCGGGVTDEGRIRETQEGDSVIVRSFIYELLASCIVPDRDIIEGVQRPCRYL